MFTRPRTATLLISALATVALLGTACGSPDEESTEQHSGATTSGINLSAEQNRISTDKVDSIAAKVPQEFRDRGTIRITGNAGTAPPLRFYADDDKTVIGSETDFAYLIAEVLGLKIDLQVADWAQNSVRIDSGDADAFISNVTVTEERKEKYDFATYRLDTLAFEVRKDKNLSLEKPEDVAGLKIGVGAATNQEALLVKWNEDNVAAGRAPAEITVYQKTTDYYLPLSSGRIDAYFGPNPSSQFHAAQTGENEVVGQFSGAGEAALGQIGVLVKKDNGLVQPISEAIDHLIENGTYEQVLERWKITNEAVDKSLVNPPGLPKTNK
ncbi:ABC transporter substrate-binding protein [Rhodococcus erythropolis]|uniref:ABC transporter substrate-binding protein n=1 Tax=Rhodococcus erythropolis TaxID=1833 RepID=UPI00083FAC5E|nr:ABC transporter substrate-binding protein [Rhodococcus erythropolis]